MKIKLSLPVYDIYVNQPFGVNFVSFYKKLGMKGHNGIDFRAHVGCKTRATHSGIVTYAGTDSGGGKSVQIASTMDGIGFKTVYYHLSKIKVKKGDNVEDQQLIGLSGNTGKYTTGAHLHFGLKRIVDGVTINRDNGYRGAIDPAPYFKKNWDKSHAYHRYYRKGNYWQEIKVRFKNPWLHRQLKKRNKLYYIYNNEFINALTYGAWDFNSLMNPAMHDIWAWSKKDEYEKGKHNFS